MAWAAAAAAVAMAVVGGEGAAVTEASIAVTETYLIHFRLRYLNFLDYSFHYSLEIIFINLTN